MKKTITIILALVIIAIAGFAIWYIEASNENKIISNYNSEYELYTEGEISGVDLTTIINKAIDNNEKYSIEKDESNAYINDNEYYTEVYIKLDDEGNTFLMEAFEQVGLTEFTRLYGSLYFKCTNINYHENGRISELTFEIVE